MSLVPPDFNRHQNASANLAKLFEDVIGCDEVIQKLDKHQKIAQTMKAQGLDMRKQIPSNFVFKGPPGTGKTMTARKLGQVYFDMGFLSSADVIECSASDLVGQYVGHTGPKKALGKVLFIDEAYRLSQGHFAQEAMDEIVDIMTKDKFMNKLVFILAGYDDMNKLLRDLRKSNIVVPELADSGSAEYQQMQTIVYRMSILSSWGNARDIKTLGKRMFQQAYANASRAVILSVTEATDIMQSMLKEQRDRLGIPTTRPMNSSPPPVASLSGPPTPPPPTASSSSSQSSKPPPPPPPSDNSKPLPPPPLSKSGGPKPPPPRMPPKRQLPKKCGDQTNTRQPTPPNQTTHAQPNATTGRPAPSRTPRSVESSPSQASIALRQTATCGSDVQRDSDVSDEVWNQLQANKRAAEEQKRHAREEESRLQGELKKARDAERQAERARMRAEALERAKQQAAADRVLLERLQRELEAARKREAEVKAQRERAWAALKRKQQEGAQRVRREQEMQNRLHGSGRCPIGYQWLQQAGGWRCAGGLHFVSDNQLRRM
ncbi:P-loop containing nucleoside triphosphate hydrolase protein [Tylopilus felleus]